MSAREKAAAIAAEVRSAIEHRLDLTGDGKLTKADVDKLTDRLTARFHDEQAKHPTALLVAGCCLSGAAGMLVGYAIRAFGG